MTKRKERNINELYHVTEPMNQAEITPVLRGSCRIQGPTGEKDCTGKNTNSYQLGRRFSRCAATGQTVMKAESGTCNVCAAPCSSCGHLNQTVSTLEIKSENEFSDEVSRVTSPSRSSFDDASAMRPISKRARIVKEPATSETSNFSASSTHNQVSENAESEASLGTNGAVETLPIFLLGEGVAHDQNIHVSSDCDVAFEAGQRTVANQHENGCNSEDVSCVSGVNDTHLVVDVDKKNISCSTASVSSLCHNDFGKISHVHSDPEGSSGVQFESKTNCTISGGANLSLEESEQKDNFINASNSLFPQADSKILGGKFGPRRQVQSSLCSVQHVDSSSEKLEKNINAQRSDAHESDDVGDKSSHMSSSYGTSVEDSSRLGAGTAVGTEKVGVESVEHLETNEQIEEPSIPPEVANIEDPPSQSQRIDESDGSDIVEDDVKICDICGDAGREDLLATCSRCSDGAEHTYCMRVPMKKVPEADWLCEVCHLKEEAANQKKDKFDTVSGAPKSSVFNENNKKSFVSLETKISAKPDTQFSDEEGNRSTKVVPSPRISSKRNSDNLEAPPTAKRQTLESISGSPKPLSPNKTTMLSRERSFKNLDKGKVKPAHLPSSGGSSSQNAARPPSVSVQNSSKIHPPLQSPRGHLLKSNSFNASNLKPKVKLAASEDILQKNKLGGHFSTSGSKKEGLVRTISKSPSFPIGSSHTASIESKAKISSFSLSRAEDLRGTKVGRESNIIESRNSFKSDRLVSPTIGSSVSCPKDEQKVSSRGEAVALPSSTAKICETKSIQADVRLSSSLKSTAGRGDLKRQSSFISRVGGHSSLNGNHAEQKPSQTNRADDLATNLSCTVDASNSVPSLVPQDGLAQSQECIEQEKKGQEPSFIMSRQNIPAAGRTTRCNKCKEIGHAAQLCPNDSMRVFVREPTATRSSKVVTNRSTMWKDTNEAAFLESSKKTGLPDHQSDELPMPSAELFSETAPKIQTPGRDVCSAEAIDLNAIMSLEENQMRDSSSDFRNQEPLVSLSSRISPIPEPEYIWQGRFDVRRNERSMDSFDGFQAHLSTCASPKVLEVANNFPHNVTLEEVSRSSTWPKQFQNCATEDNIALYFFPKDVQSYHNCFKSFVENMTKNDLALKGILNGIELLIFPSNQLAEKSQRWNMINFLWGVFRAKRMNVLEKQGISLKIPSAEKSSSMIPTTQLRTDITENGTSTSGHEFPEKKYETEPGQCNRDMGEIMYPTESKTLLDISNCKQAVLPSPSSQRQEPCSGPLKLYQYEASSISHNISTVTGGVVMTERYFFPVESGPVKDSGVASNSIPVHVISSDDEEQMEPRGFDLNLALGEDEEEESSNNRREPLLECFTGKESNHGKRPEIMMNVLEDEEDASLGSLSLSLAAPTSSSAVQIGKAIVKPKPQKSHTDTPFMLFGGFPDT